MLPTYEQAMGTAREGSPFSNGTEGECWMGTHCYRCVHDAELRRGVGPGCVPVLVSLEQRTPAEWIEEHPYGLYDRYRCVYFRDEDDGDDPEPRPIPDPPGQLDLVPREPYERPARMLVPLDQPAEVRS